MNFCNATLSQNLIFSSHSLNRKLSFPIHKHSFGSYPNCYWPISTIHFLGISRKGIISVFLSQFINFLKSHRESQPDISFHSSCQAILWYHHFLASIFFDFQKEPHTSAITLNYSLDAFSPNSPSKIVLGLDLDRPESLLLVSNLQNHSILNLSIAWFHCSFHEPSLIMLPSLYSMMIFIISILLFPSTLIQISSHQIALFEIVILPIKV